MSILQAAGITVGNVKYMFLRDFHNDGKIMTAKKKDLGYLVMWSTNRGNYNKLLTELA